MIVETMLPLDVVMIESRRFGLSDDQLAELCEFDGTMLIRITLRPDHSDAERIRAFLADLVRRDFAFLRA
jgi:hypothetical protein